MLKDFPIFDLVVKKTRVNPMSSFELEYPMVHTKLTSVTCSGEGIFKGFYHTWAWRLWLSYALDGLNIFSLPLPLKAIKHRIKLLEKIICLGKSYVSVERN